MGYKTIFLSGMAASVGLATAAAQADPDDTRTSNYIGSGICSGLVIGGFAALSADLLIGRRATLQGGVAGAVIGGSAGFVALSFTHHKTRGAFYGTEMGAIAGLIGTAGVISHLHAGQFRVRATEIYEQTIAALPEREQLPESLHSQHELVDTWIHSRALYVVERTDPYWSFDMAIAADMKSKAEFLRAMVR
jgi:hypothetical protein